MSTSKFAPRDRLYELLADEASAALDAGETAELASLLTQTPDVAPDELLRAAAITQVAFLRRTTEMDRMPAGLKARLASQGEALVLRNRSSLPTPRLVEAAGPAPTAQRPSRPAPSGRSSAAKGRGMGKGRTSGLGWALAAMLAVALVVVRTEPTTVAPTPDAVATRTSLVNGAADVITLPWAKPTAPGYENVTGDVVWSQSRQEGYLRLANMPVNDPARTQYQLWIVDPERDKNPVDGGVFDVSSSGEVIIPIQAKLQIRSPQAFAITAEQPGGVVVSAGPLLVVAST